MKKIIFFSKDLNIGGMEKSLVILLNSLVNDYDITLVLEKKEGVLLKELSSKVKVKEYKLCKIKLRLVRRIVNFCHRLIWIMFNYHHYSFACNYATYSYLGSKLAQSSSCNSSLYVHSNYYLMFHQNQKEVQAFFAKHNLNKFKSIIFVSKESQDGLLKIYPELKNKFYIINNLIDYSHILTLAQEKVTAKIDQSKKNFIFIGRLENESKNLKLLINCFLNNKNNLYIIGDGPYRHNLLKMIENSPNITYLGNKINPYPYLKLCDVLILTSNYEGFPVVFNEALVLNKDIMTTILVSDLELNIKDYAIYLKNEEKDIIKKINDYKKKDKQYKIDFATINQRRINKFKDVIEVK